MATVAQHAEAFGSRHELTPGETIKGAVTSARNRKNLSKYVVRAEKQLKKMQIEGDALKELIKFAETLTLTPVGSIVVAWFVVDFFQKIQYIDAGEAVTLKEIITGAELIGALGGGQGIAGVVGALAKVGAG